MSNPACAYITRSGGTKLIKDYLSGSSELKEFIVDFPSIESLLGKAKNHSFSVEDRQDLFDAINNQYERTGIAAPDFWKEIKQQNSFTVTTGHQLNLFGGPKYFIYKIISVLKLARDLNEKQSEFNFIPVFWLASEDHDFKEINRVQVFDQVIQAEDNQSGPVGRVEASHFKNALKELQETLGTSTEAVRITEMFSKAFEQRSWAEFTRIWVDHFFEGKVIIVDGDDAVLKKKFLPLAIREMKEHITDREVSLTNKKLESLGYHTQVGHRKINLFYLEDGIRERIVDVNSKYKINNTSREISIADLEKNPQQISPNALLRPVYQETILPNVAYVGGAGELAYWFQLKGVFDSFNTSFPILVLRDSFLFIRQKDKESLGKTGLEVKDLQLHPDELKRLYISANDLKEVDFKKEKAVLEDIFKSMDDKIANMHRDYHQMIEAEKARMRKFIDKMELRAFRDAKFREENNIRKLLKIRETYFPGGGVAERTTSFMEDFLLLGKENYMASLMSASNALDSRIKIMTVNK